MPTVSVYLPEHRRPGTIEWCDGSDMKISGIEVEDDCVVPGSCPLCDRCFTPSEVEAMESSAFDAARLAEQAALKSSELEWRLTQAERRVEYQRSRVA